MFIVFNAFYFRCYSYLKLRENVMRDVKRSEGRGEFYIGLILAMFLVMLTVATIDAMSETTTQNVSKIIQDLQGE